MKILYICEEYPPGKSGGIGTMVQNLAREAVKQGHAVYVVGLYPYGYGEAAYEEDNGVKIWRLRHALDIGIIKNKENTTNRTLLRIMKYSGLMHADTHFSLRKMFRFINKLIKDFGIDIIEMPDWNNFFQDSFSPFCVPPLPIPLVVKLNGIHSYFAFEMGEKIRPTVYRSENLLLQRADALASVSNYTAKKTNEIFQLNRDFKILYNSINIPDVPAAKRNELSVIFSGTLVVKKGIYSLLKAWNKIAVKYPSAKLHIFGKGDIVRLQRQLLKEASASVHFHGHVDRGVLLQELSKGTIAVFPSYSECFALAPLEAMAAGCAVINTSRASGTELITDHVNGLLVDPDNIESISKAIAELFDDPALRKQIGEAGRALVKEKFNITDSVKDHIQFYEQIINRRK